MEGKSSLSNSRGQAGSDLFLTLIDYLRVPLFKIARRAEASRLKRVLGNDESLGQIETTASSTLSLLDSYLLAEQVREGQINLALEPVAVSAVLYDTAQQLDALAKVYNCQLVIDCHDRQAPVMAYRPILKAALISLGQVFIESAVKHGRKSLISLSAYRAKQGVATGVFGEQPFLGRQMYRQAFMLSGRARMPLRNLSADSGAGVFVADALFSALTSRLRPTRHDNLNGLAATLITSRQLNLI